MTNDEKLREVVEKLNEVIIEINCIMIKLKRPVTIDIIDELDF